MGLFADGWAGFVTQVRDFNDGQRDCDAELDATNNVTGVNIKYYGDSKAGHGHAEMDALYQFLKAINWDTNAFQQYTLQVTCLAKPCCKYCAAVMGNLAVFASPGTYKVNKSMGISYAMPPDVRKFLVRLLNTTEQKVLEELCG